MRQGRNSRCAGARSAPSFAKRRKARPAAWLKGGRTPRARPWRLSRACREQIEHRAKLEIAPLRPGTSSSEEHPLVRVFFPPSHQ